MRLSVSYFQIFFIIHLSKYTIQKLCSIFIFFNHFKESRKVIASATLFPLLGPHGRGCLATALRSQLSIAFI